MKADIRVTGIKKRILFLTNEYPPGPGGIGNQSYNLVSFLASFNYQVTVITSSRSDFNEQEFDKRASGRIIRYESGRSFIYKCLYSLRILLLFRGVCDVVIVSGLAQQFLIWPIRILTCNRIISIIHGHEIGMVARAFKLPFLWSLAGSSSIVAVSQISKQFLEQGGLRRQVRVIPNGVTIGQGSVQSPRKFNGPLNLITVGAITSRKGQHNVVRGLPALRRKYPNMMYHLVGIPTEIDVIRNLARELDVLDLLRVHGFVEESDRQALLKASDVFLMLSENLPNGDMEGFGIAILEANLSGLPAIGSRGTGIEQAILPKLNGELIDPHSVEELVATVDLILDSYGTYSAGALTWALSHDWKIVGEKYLEILEEF